jgi:hypothetical protein
MRTCARPGCERLVPSNLLACREDWFALPKPLRDAVWRHYRQGQEHTGEISEAYLAAFRACLEWWEANP